MRFRIDHDLHIHSQLSLCSDDPEQTPQRILHYAQENGLRHICLTDHFWDETVPSPRLNGFYAQQDLAHVCAALPLPQTAGVQFHFGCEVDMDHEGTIGISLQTAERFDFIIVPTTHLHMMGFTILEQEDTLPDRARLYVRRMEALLDAPLPAHKVGLAHPTCSLMAPGDWQRHLQVLRLIPDETFERLFGRCAQRGYGVELNMAMARYTPQQLPDLLRPYRIARRCGCRFYLGSDAHHPVNLEGAMANFNAMVDALQLEDTDRFCPFGD